MPVPTYNSQTSASSGAVTSLTVSLPTSADNSPNLIVLYVNNGRDSQQQSGTSGWTQVASVDGMAIWTKDTGSSEANPVFETTDASSQTMSAIAFVFTGNTADWATKAISYAGPTADSLDPASVTISPSATGLVLALFGTQDGRRFPTANPSGYSNKLEAKSGTTASDSGNTTADKSITTAASSEDPGAWTASGNDTEKTSGTIFVYEEVSDRSGSGTITESHTVTATATKEGSGSPTISETHSVTATGSRAEGDNRSGSGSVPATSSVTASGTKKVDGDAEISSVGSAVGTSSTTRSGTGSLPGVASVTGTGVGDDGSYNFPSGIPVGLYAAIYDARTLSDPAGSEVVGWVDETANGRDLYLPPGRPEDANYPTITDSFFGGIRGVSFDANNVETLEYDEGSAFHTGDIGIITVLHPRSVFGGADAVYSTASGTEISVKHILAIDTVPSPTHWTIMSGDGSQSAHIEFGEPVIGVPVVVTQYIKDVGNEKCWIDKTEMIDEESGNNDLQAWRLASRESNDRFADIVVGIHILVEMIGVTEADLLAVRDEVAAAFNVPGFVSDPSGDATIPATATLTAAGTKEVGGAGALAAVTDVDVEGEKAASAAASIPSTHSVLGESSVVPHLAGSGEIPAIAAVTATGRKDTAQSGAISGETILVALTSSQRSADVSIEATGNFDSEGTTYRADHAPRGTVVTKERRTKVREP